MLHRISGRRQAWPERGSDTAFKLQRALEMDQNLLLEATRGALRRRFPRTSGALDLQDTLFASITLKCADKRGSYGEDSPLTVCWRACLGVGRRRGIDDVLIAPVDIWAIARCVERGHGEACGGELLGEAGQRDVMVEDREGERIGGKSDPVCSLYAHEIWRCLCARSYVY